MTNGMPDLVRLTDHAAVQSDRWLMVAVLVCTGVLLWLAAKWLAGQYNRIMDQWRSDMKQMQDQILSLHKERVNASEQFAKEIREIHRESAETSREIIRAYSEAMAKNSIAMEEVGKALAEIKATVSICSSKQQHQSR